MASNLLLIVLLVLVSVSVTSVHSISTRKAVFTQDDESYFMARSDQESSIILDVEDLPKARSLQALVAGSKVVVTKKSSSGKSWMKKKHKSSKVESLDVLKLVGIIIVAVLVTIVIICLLCNFYQRLKTKKAKSVGQGEMGAKETKTVDMSAQAGKLSNGDTNV